MARTTTAGSAAFALALLFLALHHVAAPSRAQAPPSPADTAIPAAPPPTTPAQGEDRVELRSDHQAGTFSIVIDGREIVRVTRDGMYVSGPVRAAVKDIEAESHKR